MSSSPTPRFPRDGRFIERLGYFNPLLPKDKEARLKLDMDKVKAWMSQGRAAVGPRDALPRMPPWSSARSATIRKRRCRARSARRRPRSRQGRSRSAAKVKPPAAAPAAQKPDGACSAVADRVCVAQIGAAHGVRGEVRLWPFTEDRSATRYGPLETEDGTRRLRSRRCGRRKTISLLASPALRPRRRGAADQS